jgi:hypothetical protein
LSPAITWVEFGTALVVIICSVLLCVGLVSDQSIRAELVFPWWPTFVAGMLWLLLGATTVTGRIIQWRIRKQLKT